MLLALPIGGNIYLVPLAVPVVLLLWNWLGKYVLRIKLGFTTDRFVGWALYWRVALLQLAGLLVLAAVFAPIGILLHGAGGRSRMIALAIAGIVLFAVLVYWSVTITGFVLRRMTLLIPSQARVQGARGEDGAELVRNYRTIFHSRRFGINWLLAGAYVAAGLADTLIYPTVRALIGEGFSYDMGRALPVYVLSWTIAGTGLVWILHYVRSAWQIVIAFAGLMLGLRFFESALSGSIGVGPELQLFDPQGLIARAAYGLLFGAGLLTGIRLAGPTITGFAIGTGLAELIHITLVFPPLIHLFHDVPLADLWTGSRFAVDGLSIIVNALFTGVAFWWACDRHLRRRGFRLTQQGMIEPVAVTMEQS